MTANHIFPKYTDRTKLTRHQIKVTSQYKNWDKTICFVPALFNYSNFRTLPLVVLVATPELEPHVVRTDEFRLRCNQLANACRP